MNIDCASNSVLYKLITFTLPWSIWFGCGMTSLVVLDRFVPTTLQTMQTLYTVAGPIFIVIVIASFATLRLTRSQRGDILAMLEERGN